MLNHLRGLEPDASYWVVAREKHQDGNFHLHVIGGWNDKRDIRTANYFDYEGFHPNIQAPRSLKKVAGYVVKDGDTVSYGVVPDAILGSSWGEIITNSESPRRFMKRVLTTYPKEYALRYQSLEYMAERHFKKSRTTYVSEFHSFILPSSIETWITEEFNGTHPRRKSLILESPSRYGKTEWARSLGHHMYFNSMVNFKSDWDDSAQYIIFDDIDWEYLPNKKCFFGGQKEFVITDKYSAKRTVKWGKVCIYLCNSLPDFKRDSSWYDVNCKIVSLVNPLFDRI